MELPINLFRLLNMSFIFHLPAELVHHIGGHMLATTCHTTLCILSKSCTFLQTNLFNRLVEANEIYLLKAWKKEWKNALKHVSAHDMVILEGHGNMKHIPFPPERCLLDACVEVGNVGVLKYLIMAKKTYEKEGEISRLFLQTCFHGCNTT